MIPAPLPAETTTRLLSVHPSEAVAVAAMAAEIWPKAYHDIITGSQIQYMLGSMYDPTTLDREMREEGIQFFWITADRLPVGFIAIGPVLPGDACALHKCYLLPQHQGCGIGSTALTLLVTTIEKAGASSLELRVNRHNTRAIAFYRKNRFETYAEDCLEIGGGFVMDDFLMRRQIPEAPLTPLR